MAKLGKLEPATDFAVTTFVGGPYGAGDTALGVSDGSVLPDTATAGEFLAVAWDSVTHLSAHAAKVAGDFEWLLVTSRSGGNLTATRAQLGSSAQEIQDGWTLHVGPSSRTISDIALSLPFNVKRYGATGDGATDDRAAILAANDAAGAEEIYFPPGTYVVASALTISKTARFAPGAALKPASGIVVTISKQPVAPVEQIFDASSGGDFSFSAAIVGHTKWLGESGASPPSVGTWTTGSILYSDIQEDGNFGWTCFGGGATAETLWSKFGILDGGSVRQALGASAKASRGRLLVDYEGLDPSSAAKQTPTISGYLTISGTEIQKSAATHRLVGMNLPGKMMFPERGPSFSEGTVDRASQIATRLASLGVNHVRWIKLDDLASADGLFSSDYSALDATRIAQLDYFFKKLKDAGIYSTFVVHSSHTLPTTRTGEATLTQTGASASNPGALRGVTIYHAGARSEITSAISLILNHVNDDTLAYKDDPALSVIEITNENGLFFVWNSNELDSNKLGSDYADELDSQWRAWVTTKYVTIGAVNTAWGTAHGDFPDIDYPKKTTGAPLWSSLNDQHKEDWIEFIKDTEVGFAQALKTHVNTTVGWGGNCLAITQSNYMTPWAIDEGTYRDIHLYTPTSNTTWSGSAIRSDSYGNTIGAWTDQFAYQDHAAPYVVSEYNSKGFNPNSGEVVPLMGIAQLLQGASGVCFFALDGTNYGSSFVGSIKGDLAFYDYTTKLVGLPAIAELFAGGLITKGSSGPFVEELTDADMLGCFRTQLKWNALAVRAHKAAELGGSGGAFDYYGTLFKARFGVALAVANNVVTPPSVTLPITSDTGEVFFDRTNNYLGLSAEKAIAAIGTFSSVRTLTLAGGSFTIKHYLLHDAYMAFSLVSLDGNVLTNSRSMLLVASSHSQNVGTVFETRTTGLYTATGASSGIGTPVVNENPLFELTLPYNRSKVTIYPLKGDGTRAAALVADRDTSTTTKYVIGAPPGGSLFYEVVTVV